MKRVCIIKQSCFYPQNPVVGRNAETLVGHGYEVDVICPRKRGQAKRETIGGVNVYRLPGEHHRGSALRYLFEYGSFFILASLELARLSLKKRYDVVEVDNMPDFMVYVTIFPRLLGTKVILNMLENMPQLFMSTFKKGQQHVGTKILRFIERASAGYAHRVIVADGIPYKRVLESHGVPGEKITVVLNVPDEERFNIKSLPAPEDGDHFHLMVVSLLNKRYGLHTLIEAVPLLLKDIPQLRVDVVGRGEYRPELEKRAHDLGVEAYFNFTGWVPDDELSSYMARADVTVAPMSDDVGQPLKVFEYFALGKPTVASAHPTLMATFDTDCILYFQPNDERDLAARVLELYHSPEKRASLASHAQAFYQSRRWQVTKHEYLKVYDELLPQDMRAGATNTV